MLEHIVKNGERIEDILKMYHLELDELISINLHITDFHHLQSGTKIKIPMLSAEVEQILDSTESFVQRYYPKMEEFKEEVKPEEKSMENIENKEIKEPVVPEQLKREERKAYPGILPPKLPYKRI